MFDDTKVLAAIITSLTSCFIAFIVWLRTLDIQNKTHKQAILIEELKTNMEKSRDILKNELAKELAGNETLLRIRAELRIKLFEMAVKAVEEAGVNLQTLIYVYKNYFYSTDPKEVAPRTRLAQVTEAMIGTGMFMPPELSDTFEGARNYVLGGMKQRLHSIGAIKDPNHARQIIDETFAEADLKAMAFRAAAIEWKQAEWKNLTLIDLYLKAPEEVQINP